MIEGTAILILLIAFAAYATGRSEEHAAMVKRDHKNRRVVSPRHRGFTLMEVLAVLVLLGIVALVIFLVGHCNCFSF